MKILFLLCYLASYSTRTLITDISNYKGESLPIRKSEPYQVKFENNLKLTSYFKLGSAPSFVRILLKNKNCGNIKKFKIESSFSDKEKFVNPIFTKCFNGEDLEIDLETTYNFIKFSILKNECDLTSGDAVIEKILFHSSMDTVELNIEKIPSKNSISFDNQEVVAIKINFKYAKYLSNDLLSFSIEDLNDHTKMKFLINDMSCSDLTCLIVFNKIFLLNKIDFTGFDPYNTVTFYNKKLDKIKHQYCEKEKCNMDFDKPIYVTEVKLNDLDENLFYWNNVGLYYKAYCYQNTKIKLNTTPVNSILSKLFVNDIKNKNFSMEVHYKDVCSSLDENLWMMKDFYFVGETVEYICDGEEEKHSNIICNHDSEFTMKNGDKIDVTKLCRLQ